MATQIELELEIGANFSATVTLPTTQTGRTHRAHMRETVASTGVKVNFSSTVTTGYGLITLSGNIVTLTAGADLTELLSLSTDFAHWVIDIESIGATSADIRREARGTVLVTRDITRMSESTAVANAAGLLSYTEAQTLTAGQKTQALANQGVTITPANLNALDDAANTALHFHDADRSRANHTGTQALSTLTQSGATSGQVPEWSGAAWVPATPSSGGGMAIGGAVSGATAGRIPYIGAGPVLADSSALTFDGAALQVVGHIYLDNGGYVRLHHWSNTYLSIDAGGLPGIHVRTNRELAVGGRTTINHGICAKEDDGYVDAAAKSFSVSPGAGTGTGAGAGVKLRYCSAGAVSGATFHTVTVGAELTSTGAFWTALARSQTYTLAQLNAAYPSPTVGDRAFITDETTGAFRGACVGGGSIETPVHYGNGAWKNG